MRDDVAAQVALTTSADQANEAAVTETAAERARATLETCERDLRARVEALTAAVAEASGASVVPAAPVAGDAGGYHKLDTPFEEGDAHRGAARPLSGASAAEAPTASAPGGAKGGSGGETSVDQGDVHRGAARAQSGAKRGPAPTDQAKTARAFGFGPARGH